MSKAEDLAEKAYPEGDTYIFGDASIACRVAYVKGYHQAEKDLLTNKHEKSWRLDQKLWKGIKGIEEASYQYTYDASNDWAYDVPTWDDVQDAFKAGSEWKENHELTWEDMREIDKLSGWLIMLKGNLDDKELYQEVLKRFKDLKK